MHTSPNMSNKLKIEVVSGVPANAARGRVYTDSNKFAVDDATACVLEPGAGRVVPTGTADAAGSTGEISYDNNYLYVKTAGGWRRIAWGAVW